MLKKSKIFSITSVILCLALLINCGVVTASAGDIHIGEEEEIVPINEYILPDLGVEINTIPYEDVQKIKTISENMSAAVARYNFAVRMQEISTIDGMDSVENQALQSYNDYEQQMLDLGAVKLNNEQKLKYVLGVSELPKEDGSVSTNALNYPDLDDVTFFIYEYTLTDSDGNTEYMAQCIASPTPNTGGRMIFESENWVYLYEDTRICDLITKSIKITAEGVINHILSNVPNGNYISEALFIAEAIWDLASGLFPAKTSTYKGKLGLYVSGSSRVVHYWHKENGDYRFKLATNAAIVEEGWHTVDKNGNQIYKSHEYWVYSDYYVENGDQAAIALSSAATYRAGPIKYYNKKTSFLAVLVVSPFYANWPIDFAV